MSKAKRILSLVEGTWNIPFSLKDAEKLEKLFSKPVIYNTKEADNLIFHDFKSKEEDKQKVADIFWPGT